MWKALQSGRALFCWEDYYIVSNADSVNDEGDISKVVRLTHAVLMTSLSTLLWYSRALGDSFPRDLWLNVSCIPHIRSLSFVIPPFEPFILVDLFFCSEPRTCTTFMSISGSWYLCSRSQTHHHGDSCSFICKLNITLFGVHPIFDADLCWAI